MKFPEGASEDEIKDQVVSFGFDNRFLNYFIVAKYFLENDSCLLPKFLIMFNFRERFCLMQQGFIRIQNFKN